MLHKKALQKYFSLYHNIGYDILFIPGLLKHFAWPPKSMELAGHVIKYTSESLTEYDHFLVHSTSIGAYNYTSCLMLANEHPEKQTAFFSKLIGIIFDSITFGSTERMRVGVSVGMSEEFDTKMVNSEDFVPLFFEISWNNSWIFWKGCEGVYRKACQSSITVLLLPWTTQCVMQRNSISWFPSGRKLKRFQFYINVGTVRRMQDISCDKEMNIWNIMKNF